MKRTKAIERLVEMKRQRVEAAEAAFAAARAEVVDAEQVRKHADMAWLAAHEEASHHRALVTAADLEIRDMQLRQLRRTVEETERRFYAAKQRENDAQRALTEARIELRRFELWLERYTEGQALEQRRQERVAEDEVASRRRRES